MQLQSGLIANIKLHFLGFGLVGGFSISEQVFAFLGSKYLHIIVSNSDHFLSQMIGFGNGWTEIKTNCSTLQMFI